MNQEYYGTPAASSDFIAHYGVKGMKWGVRRALQRGDINAVRKHYIKAAKKLAKLEKIGSTNSKKYATKAAAYGTGAALAGGLAVQGTEGLAKGIVAAGKLLTKKKTIGPIQRKYGHQLTDIERLERAKHLKEVADENAALAAKYENPAKSISEWGKKIGYAGEEKYQAAKNAEIAAAQQAFNENRTITNRNSLSAAKKNDRLHIGDVSNNTLARIGAGTLAAGLGVAAARNAYRAKNGAKYRAKAARFREAMNDTFDGIDMSHVQPKKRKRRS